MGKGRTVILDVMLREESLVYDLAKLISNFQKPGLMGFTFLPGDKQGGVKMPEAWADEAAKASWLSAAFNYLADSGGLLYPAFEMVLISTLVKTLEYVDVHELIHGYTEEPDEWTPEDAEKKTIEKTAEMISGHLKMVIV